MAYTQTQLDALEEAIAEGALTVQYQDKRVTYRSLAEMETIRAAMRRALGLEANSGPRTAVPRHTNGL